MESQNNKKIVIFTREFPTRNDIAGGTFNVELVKALQKYSDVTVVCPVPWCPNLTFLRNNRAWSEFIGLPECDERDGITIYYPKYLYVPVVFRAIQALWMVLGSYRVLKRIRDEKGLDVINAHFIYPAGIAATLLGILLKIPVVQTTLGSDINVYSNIWWSKPQLRWAFTKSRMVTTKSQALLDRVIEIGLPKEKGIFISDGVDSNRFNFIAEEKLRLRSMLNLDHDKKFLLFVGRLHEVKGLDVLLESLLLLKNKGMLNFYTHLIGDGPQRQLLENYVRDNNLSESVSFLGTMQHDEIHRWMKVSDALCLPSRMEGRPSVLIEAFACGLPAIASNVGGIPELVNRSNGLLVQKEDANELAQGLFDVIHKQWDPLAITETVAWANWDSTAQAYIKVFDQLQDNGYEP